MNCTNCACNTTIEPKSEFEVFEDEISTKPDKRPVSRRPSPSKNENLQDIPLIKVQAVLRGYLLRSSVKNQP